MGEMWQWTVTNGKGFKTRQNISETDVAVDRVEMGNVWQWTWLEAAGSDRADRVT